MSRPLGVTPPQCHARESGRPASQGASGGAWARSRGGSGSPLSRDDSLRRHARPASRHARSASRPLNVTPAKAGAQPRRAQAAEPGRVRAAALDPRFRGDDSLRRHARPASRHARSASRPLNVTPAKAGAQPRRAQAAEPGRVRAAALDPRFRGDDSLRRHARPASRHARSASRPLNVTPAKAGAQPRRAQAAEPGLVRAAALDPRFRGMTASERHARPASRHARSASRPLNVTPAKAGAQPRRAQAAEPGRVRAAALDPRFRGDDSSERHARPASRHARSASRPLNVTPAKAGAQTRRAQAAEPGRVRAAALDPRFRGDDSLRRHARPASRHARSASRPLNVTPAKAGAQPRRAQAAEPGRVRAAALDPRFRGDDSLRRHARPASRHARSASRPLNVTPAKAGAQPRRAQAAEPGRVRAAALDPRFRGDDSLRRHARPASRHARSASRPLNVTPAKAGAQPRRAQAAEPGRVRAAALDPRFRGDDSLRASLPARRHARSMSRPRKRAPSLAGRKRRSLGAFARRLWIPAFAGMTASGVTPAQRHVTPARRHARESGRPASQGASGGAWARSRGGSGSPLSRG